MSLNRLVRPLGLALSGLLAVTVLALVSPSAQAAAGAPTSLAPKGSISSSTPTFSWDRVKGAVGYQLVVTQDSTQTQLISTGTASNKYVPTSNLPDGDISWQVRAQTATAFSAWSSAHITITPTGAPSPTAPGDGQHLTQPDEPPLFTWSAVAGAVGYEVEVDNSGTWVNAQPVGVRGTSYYVDAPQAPGTWYWRVRANRGGGIYTSWSTTSTYVVDPLDDPQPGADMNTGSPMTDVRVDWLPVDGATSYQLQVGRDRDFNNLVDNVSVYGTSYSPPATYANDQYYWRVRAIDAGQNKMDWTTAAPFVFQRNWPDQPTLEYPLDQLSPTVGDPMYYQWTPVKHASSYQLDVGGDPNFSPGTFQTCTTTGTTYPVNGACGPTGQGTPTYWRVKGLDAPAGVEGIFSAIHKFEYSSAQVSQLTPANGTTVDVPTLSWQAAPNVQAYAVTVKDKDGNVSVSTQTSSTTFTPEVALPASGNPYRWTVQTVQSSGSVSPLYAPQTFSVSGNTPTGGTPLVPQTATGTEPATTDFPSLTWGPEPGATTYRVRIGVVGSNFYDNESTSRINSVAYPYPAATDTGTHYLSPGSYFWYVDAYDSTGHLIDTTPANKYGQFTIKDLPAVTGQKIALDGSAAQTAGAGCSNALSNSDTTAQICTDDPATPVLRWKPQPGAAGYLVYLGNDREFTGRVVNPYVTTSNTLWRLQGDLPDNTAQDAYYWFVRPCKSLSPVICNPDPISTHAAASNAFRKQSPAVQLQTPADGASLATDPSFSWSDYLDTNQARTYANGADPSYQTANTYRIQISQSPTFNTTVDDREVDQPFYTPFDRTLPQGKLYWRVQAVDPTGNHVTWSDVRSFSNDQPAIDLRNGLLTSPANNATAGGAAPFRWTPMDGASSYQIEVYRGDNGTHSPGNLVLQASTHQAAYVSGSWLPPSSQDYTWRVRWLDGDGQPRPWSSDAHFDVKQSTVTLTGPAANTYQPYNGLYLTWKPVASAATYRVDFRDSNNSISSAQTAATAFAANAVNDGEYDWRVAALDANNNAIAISAWRTFTVDTHGPTITKFSPNSVGKPKSKIKVTWNEKVKGVSTTSFLLKVDSRKSRLPAKVKLAANGRSATLTPKKHLKKGHVYTVTLSTAIKDHAGNHAALSTWSFSV